MFAAARKLSQSWFAPIIFGALTVALSVFAIPRDLFSVATSDNVITSTGRNISSNEYRDMYGRAKQQAEQQAGQSITPDMAVQAGFDYQVMNQAAQDTALTGLVRKLHLIPSETAFNNSLKQYTAFFDKVTGKFDANAYAQALASNNITPADFKRQSLDQLGLGDLSTAVGMGVKSPAVYSAMVSALLQEKRDFVSFEINEKSLPAPAAPTDAQLADFIKSNNMSMPELRTFSEVKFSAADLAKTDLPIDPAAVQKRFDFEKDTLNKPETRSYVLIPVKDAAEGQQVADRLNKGEDPAAVAKSIGKEVSTATDKPQTAIDDKALATAIFAAAQGKATAPVATSLGTAVAKVTGITAGKTVTLDQVRPQIEAELKATAAKQKAYDESEAYTKAKQGGSTMEAAAAAAGAKVETFGPVAASGATPDQKLSGADADSLKRAFALKAGQEEDDVVDDGNGEYSVIRADKITPAHPPSVDEIRADVTKAYIQKAEMDAVTAKANALADRVRNGEDPAKVAAEAGAKLTTVTGLSQESAQSRQDLAPVLSAVFSGKAGNVTVATTNTGLDVVKVTAISQPDVNTLAQYAVQQRETLSQQMWQDIATSLQRGALREMKVKGDINKARAAMGMDADTVKKLAASKTAPASAAPAK